MKKGIAWLLAVVLLIGLLPLWAFAEGGEPQGDGTKQTPYQIADADDLMAFAQKVNEEGETSACAELVNNIDLTDYTWTPITGPSYKQPWQGTFDGRGYTVTINIHVDDDWSGDYVGLFDGIKNSTVKNIRMAGKVTAQEGLGLQLCYGAVAATLGRNNTIATKISSQDVYLDKQVFNAL